MRPGTGVFLGTGFLTAGLTFHHSDTGVVLGRWSLFYATFLTAWVLVTLFLGVRLARARPADGRRSTRWSSSRPWLELSALTYGAGYLSGAIANPSVAGHLLDLSVVGSLVSTEIILGWLALVFLYLAALMLMLRVPGRWLNPALLLATLLLSALGIEGWARGAAILDPEVQGFPTNRSWIWSRRFLHLNAAGFRDRDHAAVAAPGVRRLLIVGDSFGAGYGIDNPDDRFGSRLGELLSEATGSRWEVIHCARPDTHTLQHLQFLNQCLSFGPEIVILLYVFNDINYLIPHGETSLAAHPSALTERLRPSRLLFLNSFAFQELYVRTRHLMLERGLPAEMTAYHDPQLVTRHLGDVARFVKTARDHGARVAIVPFSVLVTISAPERERYRIFVDAARKADLPVWPTDSIFTGMSLKELRVGPLDAHPNPRANALLGHAVLPEVLHLLAEK